MKQLLAPIRVFNKTGSWGGVTYPANNGENPFAAPATAGGFMALYLRGTETSCFFWVEVEDFSNNFAEVYTPDNLGTRWQASLTGTAGSTVRRVFPISFAVAGSSQLFGKRWRIGVGFIGTTDAATRVEINIIPVVE